MKIAGVCLLILAAFLLGFAMGGHAGLHKGTYCPTEDSCGYHYSDHVGTVVTVTP